MTPYELRFEIFKQSYNMLQDQYSVEYDAAVLWNEDNVVKMDYPEYPTLSDVLDRADIINRFVSETKQVSCFLKASGADGITPAQDLVITQLKKITWRA